MKKETKSFEINNYLWENNGYCPKTSVKITRDEGGFLLEFVSYESKVRAQYKEHNQNVYCDSCMECFLKPCTDDDRYFNFETNANGAMLCGKGAGRDNRSEISASDIDGFNIRTAIYPDRWELSYYISADFIKRELPSYRHGEAVYGNFTKCGDDTEFPHFGSWQMIESPTPDFHQSKFFARIF